TVFLEASDTPNAYGVLALHDDFADLFPHVPLLIDTVLLPFKNQITYDGQCRYYNIMFGGGITRRLNESYQLAKAHSGIITTLPFVASEAAPSDEERLRFYVRTARTREQYWEEIVALRQHSRALETLYQQEVNHCPLKEAGFDNKFCSPIEGSQSLLDWASLGRWALVRPLLSPSSQKRRHFTRGA